MSRYRANDCRECADVRLLLVEDDRTISRFVLKGLREDHHVVDLAEDGLAALDQAGAADYDAVVLDLMLPGLDGFDLCRQMRGQEIDTPVLVISARDAVRDRVRALDCGADDYLVKPFAFEELLACQVTPTYRWSVFFFSTHVHSSRTVQ